VHYAETVTHNSVLGEDHIWYNLKIWDMTAEEKGRIMDVLLTIYAEILKREADEHAEWKRKRLDGSE
jgi:hypothetical protein